MFEPSKELAILKGLLNDLPAGAYIAYAEIEQQTGVAMNVRGKCILRSALRSLKREYHCDRGNGIELENPANAMVLVTGRVKRVNGSLRRADKTVTRMAERYMEKLPKDDRDRLLATASLFGAIKAMAKGLSSIYKPGKLQTLTAETIADFRKTT